MKKYSHVALTMACGEYSSDDE